MAYVKRGGHGGARAGAGRTKGAKNALPQGAVMAIKALRHRVPDDLPEDVLAAADDSLGVVVAVMRGEIVDGARDRLTAAAMVREEICGPVPKKHELTGKDGGPVVIDFGVDLSRKDEA